MIPGYDRLACKIQVVQLIIVLNPDTAVAIDGLLLKHDDPAE